MKPVSREKLDRGYARGFGLTRTARECSSPDPGAYRTSSRAPGRPAHGGLSPSGLARQRLRPGARQLGVTGAGRVRLGDSNLAAQREARRTRTRATVGAPGGAGDQRASLGVAASPVVESGHRAPRKSRTPGRSRRRPATSSRRARAPHRLRRTPDRGHGHMAKAASGGHATWCY
jgi:hypothetical protein